VSRPFSGQLNIGVAVNNDSNVRFVLSENRLAHKRKTTIRTCKSNDSRKCKICNSTPSSSLIRLKTPISNNKNGSTTENTSNEFLKMKIYNYETVVVAVVNCRCLKNNIPELHNLINSTGGKIIIGTESWLTDDISNSEIFVVLEIATKFTVDNGIFEYPSDVCK
jgi:hypothetical protein